MAETYSNARLQITSPSTFNVLYNTQTPTTATLMNSIVCSNTAASAANVTIDVFKNASSITNLITNALIPAGTSLQVLDTPIVLTVGDIVRVSSTTGNLHIFSSFMELS